ncbi:mediator complex subunit MED14-domain-containing protein [Lasiosphaeria miniovina]|uniref:Mediator of RNA polymerase II transcription subunit 14 n=1 Tax=Lasiosphaeria miniovina TaxID=1954250 RepID=A0AA40BH21_9PEZI|nr:mediator complex subunit MED14-domain-containing protein [Lasiosphaeria miniovina]KAK0734100.1 mediator complex subunit MED14-domain-containing protein [Lasiosphaeria miniovina]
MSPDNGKGLAAIPDNPSFTNSGAGTPMDVDSEFLHDRPGGRPVSTSINDLPDEIQHITAEIMPLSVVLMRLAQWTHVSLQDQVGHLASKPLPQNMANGNANYSPTSAEDASPESLDKKQTLLTWAMDIHTRWTKLLVITEWSKRSEHVGRLIDMKNHLQMSLERYGFLFWDLVKVKNHLRWATVASPDLKTALEVLSSGEASWMPELSFIAPPPISLEERESWMDNINTLLSVRLSFDEHERLPLQFRDYTVGSGRVTFMVKDEFEVDLTIGDEDFEKQFWFIDFRFGFGPAPVEISERVRQFLEHKVNLVLGNEGLAGCYRYLHEFVLTQKIGEFRRQAVELSMGRWIDAIKVERLNRALAIQYWLNRPHSQGSKSWIIIGVYSGNGFNGLKDLKTASWLQLRWFRDNKEVKDFDIPWDLGAISVEALLTTVIARHVEFLLTAIYKKLAIKPRFARRQASMALQISKDEPLNSSLTLQLFDDENATIRIDPVTGSFTLFPQCYTILDGQHRLNSSPSPADDGPVALEQLRWNYTLKDFNSRAKSLGWTTMRPPIPSDDLKSIVYSGTATPTMREPYIPVWLRKAGWSPQWFLMLSLSLGGDQWWLVELSGQKPGLLTGRLKMFIKMPMSSSQLSLSDTFFQNLAVYATGMISQLTDLRELHSKKMAHTARESTSYNLFSQVKIPTLYVRLSDMLRSRTDSAREPPTPWARDFIPINFKGIQNTSDTQDAAPSMPRQDVRVKIIAEARLAVTNKEKFKFLKGNVDHDVVYNPRIGQFSLRLRADMGTPVVNLLSTRIQALERLVDFVQAISKAGKNAVPESVTLREVVFTYCSSPPQTSPPPPIGGTSAQQQQSLPPRAWRVRLDLAKEKDQLVSVALERGNPHLRVLDFLTVLANSPNFESLPLCLLFTLPLYRGLEKVENAWEPIVSNNEGSCQIFPRSVTSVTIRYTLLGTPGSLRQLNIELQVAKRKGKTMWHVFRSAGGGGIGARDRNDEFDKVLQQRVWSARGIGFKGLVTSAAADPEKGIEALLDLIDESVRSLVGTPMPPAPPIHQQTQVHGGHEAVAATAAASAPIPQANMAGNWLLQQQHQQQQQQHQQQRQSLAQASAQHHQQQQHHQRPGGNGGGGTIPGGNSNAPLILD